MDITKNGISTCRPLKSLRRSTICFLSSNKNHTEQSQEQRNTSLANTMLGPTTYQEISTLSPGSDPRTTSQDQSHPKEPQHPSRHSGRTLCVFGPFWPLPKDPLGPPRTPKGHPRNHQGPSPSPGVSKHLPRPPERQDVRIILPWHPTSSFNGVYTEPNTFVTQRAINAEHLKCFRSA